MRKLDCVHAGAVAGVCAQTTATVKVPNNGGGLESHVVHATGSYEPAVRVHVKAGDVAAVANEKGLGTITNVRLDHIRTDGVYNVGSAGVNVKTTGSTDFTWSKY